MVNKNNKNEDLIIKVNDKIIKATLYKKVLKIGTGAHIVLPLALLGKTVMIEYKKEENNKNGRSNVL